MAVRLLGRPLGDAGARSNAEDEVCVNEREYRIVREDAVPGRVLDTASVGRVEREASIGVVQQARALTEPELKNARGLLRGTPRD